MRPDADDGARDQSDTDATAEQLTELRRLGVTERELEGLSFTDAEEWIDELRTQRRDAGQFGPSGPRSRT
jgi:hypothetical protein